MYGLERSLPLSTTALLEHRFASGSLPDLVGPDMKTPFVDSDADVRGNIVDFAFDVDSNNFFAGSRKEANGDLRFTTHDKFDLKNIPKSGYVSKAFSSTSIGSNIGDVTGIVISNGYLHCVTSGGFIIRVKSG